VDGSSYLMDGSWSLVLEESKDLLKDLGADSPITDEPEAGV
jgi:hypothetical protein